MEVESCVFLGVKVKPGPIERFKVENFPLDNTVSQLKTEAEKKTNVPSIALELIHHGKILKDRTTLKASGIKSGEMVHVVKKKVVPPPKTPQNFTDAELQEIAIEITSYGCIPYTPGWTRATQVVNDEATMAEITEAVPSLSEDCVTLSMLHEVDLLAALGADVHTMRRGATAIPDLPIALRHLIRLVRSNTTSPDDVPMTGYEYSLEALEQDERCNWEYDAPDLVPSPELEARVLRAAARIIRADNEEALGGSGAGGGADGGLVTEFERRVVHAGLRALLRRMNNESVAAEAGAPAVRRNRRRCLARRAGRVRRSAGRGGAGGAGGAGEVEGGPRRGGRGGGRPGRGRGRAARPLRPRLQRMHEMGLINDAVIRPIIIARASQLLR